MVYRLTKQRQRGPVAYDRHVYFVDFQNLCRKCKSPTWFRYKFFNRLWWTYLQFIVCMCFNITFSWIISMIRDPVRKFISRYHYNRLVNIYPKLAKSKSPIIKYGSMSEEVCDFRFWKLYIRIQSIYLFKYLWYFLHGKLNLGYRNGWPKTLNHVWMT